MHINSQILFTTHLYPFTYYFNITEHHINQWNYVLKKTFAIYKKLSLILWNLIKENHQTYCPLSRRECKNHKTFARMGGGADQDSALRLLCNGFKLLLQFKEASIGYHRWCIMGMMYARKTHQNTNQKISTQKALTYLWRMANLYYGF